MSHDADSDGFPIRNYGDLQRWEEASTTRLQIAKERLDRIAPLADVPGHGGVTREQAQAALVAYRRAHEDYQRMNLAGIRFHKVMSMLFVSKEETLAEVLERIGPQTEAALMLALFGGEEDWLQEDEGDDAPLSFPDK